MPTPIDRDELRRLVAAGAQLVDVLPEQAYSEEHLPGAINIPLEDLDREAEQLDRAGPVIVYCFNYRCDLSVQAAWRLERIGFSDVYDYVAGKADWRSAGLPLEGTRGSDLNP
jgi:rhodanese-related sulfurtransferase